MQQIISTGCIYLIKGNNFVQYITFKTDCHCTIMHKVKHVLYCIFLKTEYYERWIFLYSSKYSKFECNVL